MEKDGHFLAMQEPKKIYNNYLFVCTYVYCIHVLSLLAPLVMFSLPYRVCFIL